MRLVGLDGCGWTRPAAACPADVPLAEAYRRVAACRPADPFEARSQGSDEAAAIADLLRATIQRGSPVALAGDFDVDGCSSIAIAAHVLRDHGVRPVVKIPDRFGEGYGLTPAFVERLLASLSPASFVIVMDMGVNSFSAVESIKNAGHEVVVIDHHQPETVSEPHVLFNPLVRDDPFMAPKREMPCAAALTAIALWPLIRQEITAEIVLQLAGLATVADVMRLQGANRSLVRDAVNLMRTRTFEPIAAVMGEARVECDLVTAETLAFKVAPVLNAVGRLGSAVPVARLLASQRGDRSSAAWFVAENARRREIESQAVRVAETCRNERDCLVAVAHRDVHPGVAGLVASRLAERYRKPALAAYFGDGVIRGSGRSRGGVDLGAAIRKALAARLLITGGGHAAACGFSLDPADWDFFLDFLAGVLEPAAAEPADERIDVVMPVRTVTVDEVFDLHDLGPFGQGAPAPRFMIDGPWAVERSMKSGLALKIGGVARAIAFGSDAKLAAIRACAEAGAGSIIGRWSVSRFLNATNVDFLVEDVACAGV